MNLFLSLRSEMIKTKRTASFYFTLAGAAVVPLLFLLNVISHGLPDEDRSTKDPLNAIFKLSSEMTGLGILPLFVVLICTLLPQIEYKNNTWKQVLTTPQTKAAVFMAKFMNIHLFILLFLLANHLFMWLVVLATHFIIPDLNLLHRPLNFYTVWANIVNSYLTILALCSIQFWIGLRIKNFIVPIAIGLALWLTGTVMVLEYHSELANYFPYSFHVFGFSPQHKPELTQVEWTSAGYAAFFLTMGFLDFRKKRMTA